MRLLELEIANVRGIKTARLLPGGKNMVVWGPNGSGKSAVVDAVDFLLTGKISRLVGEGTAGITLREHGPHVDHEPQETSVRAVIEVPGHEGSVELQRSIAAPQKLNYPLEAEDALRPVLDAAAKGQHVLSRRHILRYVGAEAGKRASEVQGLLDLSDLEDIRKTLTKARSAAKAEDAQAASALRTVEATVKANLKLATFDEDLVLAEVNRHRTLLSGAPLSALSSKTLKSDLSPPAGAPQAAVLDRSLLQSDCASLAAFFQGADEGLSSADAELRRLLDELRQDEAAARHLRRLKLLELGVTLLDEDGACPLCGTGWPPGELERHLRQHIADAKLAARGEED